MGFYTVDEVASKLKVHPRTVRRKIEQGEIQGVKFGKQYRIYQEQFDRQFGEITDKYKNTVFASVSSVIELNNIDEQTNIDINSKITSAFFTPLFKGSVHCSFNKEMKKMKIFLDCELEIAVDILTMLKVCISSILD